MNKNFINRFQSRHLLAASLALALLGSGLSVRAQTVLKMSDYGAQGDAVQFYARTAAGSPLVTTTNRFSGADIG